MTAEKIANAASPPSSSILAPLRQPLFRRIWIASLLSNLGFMLLSVGAAWTMTSIAPTADMVALVQTALMLPMMMLSIPAGAIADMYDRRKVGLAALCISLLAASGLTLTMATGLITPWLLLGFCFLVGGGMALFSPSWQAAVSEQVPPQDLPPAIALNSISFNIARSFGPAIGGVIVATAGSVAAFGITALSYVPLFIVMLLWRRTPVPSRLAPERIDRAVNSGLRYAFYSHVMRVVLIRTFVFGLGGCSVSALLPIITRELVHGEAQTYGILLGAFGMGSVLGALCISAVRRHLSEDAVVLLSSALLCVCIAIMGLSPFKLLTIVALVGAGIGWMVAITLFNVSVQMSVPRWVTGRAVATFQASIAGGVAIGSWMWGDVAERIGITGAMLTSAGVLALSLLLSLKWKMPTVADSDRSALDTKDPEVALSLTGRSGPIIIEVEYRIAADDARSFYNDMQKVRAMRLRNGGCNWSIARDVADPEYWCERYHFPTWHDYLRQRSRHTADEMAYYRRAREFHIGPGEPRIRRLLERPLGSVRWREDVPDFGPELTDSPHRP